MSTWILRMSESKTNYWGTYAVDLGLMTFFLMWDSRVMHTGLASIAAFYALGLLAWTLTEYVFHRWVYHLEFGWLFSHGHDRHHEDPTSYTAMPLFVTPLLFIPLQQLVAGWFDINGTPSAQPHMGNAAASAGDQAAAANSLCWQPELRASLTSSRSSGRCCRRKCSSRMWVAPRRRS